MVEEKEGKFGEEDDGAVEDSEAEDAYLVIGMFSVRLLSACSGYAHLCVAVCEVCNWQVP